MARIIGGGTPVNDAERLTIAHLRDQAPDEWLVLHNFEIPVRGSKYEIDVVVITEHSVVLIDVKGTRGRIEVAGRRWYPERRGSFGSPVAKLVGLTKAFKGRLTERKPQLSQVYFDSLIVLTADDADLIDPNEGTDADANNVTSLAQLVPTLKDVSRVRAGMLRNIRRHGTAIVQALEGVVVYPTGPRQFGNWVVDEELGGTEEVTEYRALNATVASSETVLLRVYRADPFQPESVRAAERIEIANAYEILGRMGRSPYIVGQREFFAVEDESEFVLVLDDVHGEALHVHLTNPRRPLSADAKLRVFGDVLRGLAHAHRNRVIHRALSPAAVLVTGGGTGMLTGFDYARPEAPRNHTVINRLTEALDPVYVAPECQDRPQAMSTASDVYAAGVVAFQLLTGDLPFVSSADQFEKGSVLPAQIMESAGVPDDLAGLLQQLCSLAPSARPSASKALRELLRIAGNNGDGGGGGGNTTGGTESSGEQGPDYRNLPEGHQLTLKYTVRRKLGSGSYGHVYQVYDNMAAEDRAVKIVTRDRESLAERIRQEYQILQRLDPHDNVVKAESADYLPDGTPYLAFEYLDGRDVHELIKERRLGPADAVKFGVDIARGLVFLHDNKVFHCDIKPRNLMLTDKGGKILDFNVAVTGDSSMSRAGGTSRYAPPDTRSAGRPSAAELIDRDVYGLGLTFYQVVTGQWPFRSMSPRLGEAPLHPREHGMADLSEAFVSAMLKAIAPQRSDRFASSAEFLAALEAVGDNVHHRPVEPEPSPALQPARDGTNPFVDHLKTLYSQSTSSNAGTRGHDAFDLYVPTQLDRELLPAVLKGDYGLVVITGNAGDGKTAFLERLVQNAIDERGADPGAPRANGADVRLANGTWLRTNHDGSQDEGDKVNDDVLLDFFGPFTGAEPSGERGEARLIAINEGRLIDFLSTHAERFGGLKQVVKNGLTGAADGGRIAVVNLNRRSVVADVVRDSVSESVFDRMLRRMTHEHFWEACDSCELATRCYAPHNARTFAHPSAGPQVTRRLKRLYTVTHLRGRLHMTLRDLRSGLAYMLTSGRSCAEIQELYGAAGAASASGEENAQAILDGFYFNSWAGAPGTEDRLLAQLRQVDVATVPEPALDRRLDYTGPDAGQAVMTVDQRGEYDMELLRRIFTRLPRGTATATLRAGGQAAAHGRYLASARRRFYFECVDEQRSRRLLPYRSADRFLDLLEHPDRVPGHLGEVIEAINRGEGLPDPRRLGDHLALQVRQVPGGTIRSYRLFESASFALAPQTVTPSPYLEVQPSGLVLSHRASSGQTSRLLLRLDLYELLHRLRAGYLPGIAEAQGLYLALTIFKNELSAAPYQEVLLTTGGTDLHRIKRESDARLTMRTVTVGTADADEAAGGE